MNRTNGILPTLVKSLMRPEIFDHAVDNIQLIETHISWVILTGRYVYKLKKPLNLGFLDFSTLDKRRFYCEEEVRLNRRLAPTIYLSVVVFHGTVENPSLSGNNEILEYAVKMKQFPQDAQMDRMLQQGELNPHQIDELAKLIAQFHQQIETADDKSHYGDLQHVYSPVEENFKQIRERKVDVKYYQTLIELERWSKSTYHDLSSILVQRKQDGFIRECHGDMHLRNLAWYQNQPIAFDCLEFNANLRWIDVISEVAFLIMDLHDKKQYHLAQRFLNTYLQATGDYSGLEVLRYYLVYRALVRAKVNAIRLHQEGLTPEEKVNVEKEFEGYLQLAKTYTQKLVPQLIITRGMSASGKSTLTQPILERLGAIRIRSDMERKRLFNIEDNKHAEDGIGHGIYSTKASQQTYQRLYELANVVIDAGYSVIVDAVFLNVEQRKPFERLSMEKGIPYNILEFFASEKTLRNRIIKRELDISDADLSVLEDQLKKWKPLEQDECKFHIEVNTEIQVDIDSLVQRINITM